MGQYKSGAGVMKDWTERLFAIWDGEDKGSASDEDGSGEDGEEEGDEDR